MEANRIMVKSRANLVLDEPFFGTLILKLILEETEDLPTAATDSVSLFYNPDFVKKMPPHELRTVLAHEVLHCTGCHSQRRGERDKEMWNVACDYAINPILVNAGFCLPKGGLLHESFDDMTPEAIYNQLSANGMPEGHKPCDWGLVQDTPKNGLNPKSDAQLEAEWQLATVNAVEQAKAAGKLPGGMEHFLKDILEPKVDWRSVLWPFISQLTNDDYSWRKPNRAYISEDEYLPAMHSESAGELAIIRDTSGSCDAYQQTFISEVHAVFSQLRPSAIRIIDVDTQVRQTIDLDRDDEWPANTSTKGGGGTRFAPAFKYIEDNYPDVEAAVYLTDLEANDFGEEPEYPVLWVSTSNRQTAPWGEVTFMEAELQAA